VGATHRAGRSGAQPQADLGDRGQHARVRDQAWATRDACAARWDTPHPELDALRAGWTHDALLYPDLVCLNTDPQGAAQGLCTYVSVK
jgi:hypothetical protein